MCVWSCCERVQMMEQFNHQSPHFPQITFHPYDALSWRLEGSRFPGSGGGGTESQGHMGTLRKDVRCPWG